MKASKKSQSDSEVKLTGILAEFREALNEEIEAIKKNGQSSTVISSGHRLENQRIENQYRFLVEYAPNIPPGTPCKLKVGIEQYDVTVVAFDGSSITLSSKVQLPDTLGKATLENGSTMLMERLIKCIEENAEKENPAGERMLRLKDAFASSHVLHKYLPSDLHLEDINNDEQNKAIIAALSNDITYIWGPPGTGKTSVIGQIIQNLFEKNRSVLIVSHTNTAVDGAIDKAVNKCKDNTSDNTCPVLRLGDPVKQLDKKVSLSAHAAILGKDLYEKKDSLENRKANLTSRLNGIERTLAKKYWVINNNLDLIAEALQEEKQIKTEYLDLKKEMDNIAAAITAEKEAHPEFSQYMQIREEKGKKAKELEHINKQLESVKEDCNDLLIKIQVAQSEIKKHDLYAQLSVQLDAFMPEQFYRSEIKKLHDHIFALEKSIAERKKEKDAAQQTIDEYSRKGAIGRLLSGKKMVAQAQAVLHEADFKLIQRHDELENQRRKEKEYQTVLSELCLLKKKIKDATPTGTKAYWENIAEQWKDEHSTAMNMLPMLEKKKESLIHELDDLEKRISFSNASIQVLSRIGQRKKQVGERLSQIPGIIKEISAKYTELLKQEIQLCLSFFEGLDVTSSADELYSNLRTLLEQIRMETNHQNEEILQKSRTEISEHIGSVQKELEEIEKAISELERQVIQNAKVVGTTLTKAYLDEKLRERTFDTVILDEASMAAIPALWCAAYLAERNIVIVGDFLQLPPIVIADNKADNKDDNKAEYAKKWLGKDIFFHSKMIELAKGKTIPSNFVMLTHQFRTERDIAELANIYYLEYGGLKTDADNKKRISDRENFYKWYSGKRTEGHIHLIDTESLNAWVTSVPQGKTHSRLNCFSAAIDVDLAFKLIENKIKENSNNAKPSSEPYVLIIAPYKAHVARINDLIALEYKNRGLNPDLGYIKAGTVHSFQGSEADIVIFDLVIDEPHWRTSLQMPREKVEINNNNRKIFNVAITRARFKLFIVGNFKFCLQRAKNNALAELLNKLLVEKKLPKVDAKALFPHIMFERQTSFTIETNTLQSSLACLGEDFYHYFVPDILSCRKRMIIFSPFMTEKRLGMLLPAFADVIHNNKEIIVITKEPEEHEKTALASYLKCENELRKVGVYIVHKKGMHEKVIIVDNDVIWMGSLNTLSFNGETGEIMQRYADQTFVNKMSEILDISHILSAIEKPYELKCPACGNEMGIRNGNGEIYWKCNKCGFVRNSKKPYPMGGIVRCKTCGAPCVFSSPYIFEPNKVPHWSCSEKTAHKQNISENDLKLKLMASMIPKASMKQINMYFEYHKK